MCLQDRNDRILTATILLEENKLTPVEFLRRVTFHNTRLEPDIDQFEGIGKNVDEAILGELEKDDDELEPTDTPALANEEEKDICSVCYDRKPRVLLMPCQQMCLCVECFEKMKETANETNRTNNIECPDDELKFNCPMCGLSVLAKQAIICFVSSA